MIDFDAVTVTYPQAETPALRNVSLHIPEGEMCLVVGRTGVGKSTFLGAINGLVPHFTGGELSGRVTVAGLDTRTHPPRELAGVVGVVMQDPVNGFVTDTVEEELAYGMEQLAIPAAVMRKRVEETLDLLGIADLRRRSVRSLSGGQQQRVAIGSVLTAHPKVLVLDEPTSALDPAAAEDVLAALTRLVHDLGVTVVLAEHRLERVIEFADMVVVVDAFGNTMSGSPAEMMRVSEVAPPVVRLAQAVGWDPLPLSVRDARRRSADLRTRLDGRSVHACACRSLRRRAAGCARDRGALRRRRRSRRRRPRSARRRGVGGDGPQRFRQDFAAVGAARHRPAPAGRSFSRRADPACRGRRTHRSGAAVARRPAVPLDRRRGMRARRQRERANSGVPPRSSTRSCRASTTMRIPRPVGGTATGLGAGSAAVPATGHRDARRTDARSGRGAKIRFASVIEAVGRGGRAVVVATHDVEFVANVADRVVVMAEGEIVADGPTADVVVASPIFAPQVAKVMRPAAG